MSLRDVLSRSSLDFSSSLHTYIVRIFLYFGERICFLILETMEALEFGQS